MKDMVEVLANEGKRKILLQLFGEGDGGGSEGGNGGGTGSEGGNGGSGDGKGGTGGETLSFEEFLKQEGNQAEFDRRVDKAVQTAVKNAEEKWKVLMDDSLSEAEKLAKMTKEEKAAYKTKKLEDLRHPADDSQIHGIIQRPHGEACVCERQNQAAAVFIPDRADSRDQ